MFKTGYLNGFRALAAFSALTAHCMIWSGWPGLGLPILPAPGLAAKLAVDLFMILSGFLMALNANERSSKEPITRASSWMRFYIRRIFRIAPAYYFSLVVAVLLAKYHLRGTELLAERIPWLADSIYNGRHIVYSMENIMMHVTFVFGLIPSWTFSTQLPDWSLSLEMQYYLIFPALAFLIARFGPLKISVILVPICMFATTQLRSIFPEPSLLFFKLPVFLAGMFIFYMTIASTLTTSLLLSIVALILPLTQVQFYGRNAIWIILAVGLILLLNINFKQNTFLYYINKYIVHLFDNRVTKFGSDLSYSIYLFHGFFITIIGGFFFSNHAFSVLNPHLKTAALFAAVLIGTLAVSIFVHRVIEKPGIKAGKRLIMRLGSAPVENRVAST